MPILPDLSMEEYLKHPAISSSQLKMILSSPRDFQASLCQKSEGTPSTVLGTAVHMAILEPAKFSERYALQPEDWGPKNKGDGYKKWNDFKTQNQGKTCIGWEEGSLISRILESCQNHKSLRNILSAGRAELTALCSHKEYEFKARADWVTEDGFIWDLKTTSKDMGEEDLQKTIFFNGYHFQAAHYLTVFRRADVDVKGFGWVFISTQTPAVHIITRQASASVIEAGKYDHSYALQLFEVCNKTNDWYGFDDEVREINLPEFAMTRNYSELQIG